MPKLADEINLKFVQLYREEECLWNASIPSHKDKQMRNSSLEKIRDILNKDGIEMSIKEIKNKIKNLRATYCQELTKIEKSERSGAGTAEVYKPKIIWFEEMHNFIKKVPMKRKTSVSYFNIIYSLQLFTLKVLIEILIIVGIFNFSCSFV